MAKLFGTDGIRGTVGVWPLRPDFFLKLGQSVGSSLLGDRKNQSFIIGRDPRSSSQMLQIALMSGLLSRGVKVIDIGVFPTSGIAWLVKNLGADAGAVISASHNPVDQNGVKFFDSSGYKLSEAIEGEIEYRLLNEANEWTSENSINGKPGEVVNGSKLKNKYLTQLLEEHPDKYLEGLTIVADCANGAAFYLAPEIFRCAGAEVIAVHSSPNGENINLRCGSEHMRRFPDEFSQPIKQNQADFGLAFDGDADRVVFVDENGSLIDGDHILGLLAHYLDKKQKLLARSVVTTNMRNAGLKSYIEDNGLCIYETEVGDKYVVEKILELQRHNPGANDYGLGGEQAGHVAMINGGFTTGDGIRTALYLMQAFKESGAKSMGEFASILKKTPQIIASAHVGDGPRFEREKLDGFEKQLLSDSPGVSRANLRYSGTEPIFRVMLESDKDLTVNDLAKFAQGLCNKAQKMSGVKEGMVEILNCTNGGLI